MSNLTRRQFVTDGALALLATHPLARTLDSMPFPSPSVELLPGSEPLEEAVVRKLGRAGGIEEAPEEIKRVLQPIWEELREGVKALPYIRYGADNCKFYTRKDSSIQMKSCGLRAQDHACLALIVTSGTLKMFKGKSLPPFLKAMGQHEVGHHLMQCNDGLADHPFYAPCSQEFKLQQERVPFVATREQLKAELETRELPSTRENQKQCEEDILARKRRGFFIEGVADVIGLWIGRDLKSLKELYASIGLADAHDFQHAGLNQQFGALPSISREQDIEAMLGTQDDPHATYDVRVREAEHTFAKIERLTAPAAQTGEGGPAL